MESDINIKYIAELSRLELSAEQTGKLQQEMERIIGMPLPGAMVFERPQSTIFNQGAAIAINKSGVRLRATVVATHNAAGTAVRTTITATTRTSRSTKSCVK